MNYHQHRLWLGCFCLYLSTSTSIFIFAHQNKVLILNKRFTLQPTDISTQNNSNTENTTGLKAPNITSDQPPENNLTSTPTNNQTKVPLANSVAIPPLPPPIDHSCDQVPLTVAVWKELQIDSFLKSYPNGHSLSLEQFAAEHGAYNFHCGLSETCHAGQLCAPIKGPAWYVLFAAQQWNIFQDALYNAIGFVSTEIQAIGAQLVQDLFPPVHHKKSVAAFRIGMGLTILSAMAAAVACGVFMYIPGLQPLAYASAMAAASAVGTTEELLRSQREDKLAGKEDPFTRWAHYAEEISKWQSDTQNSIGNQLQKHITTGVSTDEGIYSVIKDGQFGFNVQPRTLADLENGYREVLTARLVTEMLRSKEAFVTVGSDPCNQGGPGGAFKVEDGWLSYCDSAGTMMNIIAAHNDNSDNSWHNAGLISQKYGITVEYLVKQSIACQKKHGFAFDPYASGALPEDKNSECISNLLVCDCTLPGMHHARKKHNTVWACRHTAGVQV